MSAGANDFKPASVQFPSLLRTVCWKTAFGIRFHEASGSKKKTRCNAKLKDRELAFPKAARSESKMRSAAIPRRVFWPAFSEKLAEQNGELKHKPPAQSVLECGRRSRACSTTQSIRRRMFRGPLQV